MAIWRTAPVSEEPIIDLILWSVWRTEQDELHLVGMRPNSMTARVSSAVTSLDAECRSAVTGSGREYRLMGPPGHHADAVHVWRTWCAVNHVEDAFEVTANVLTATRTTGEAPE